MVSNDKYLIILREMLKSIAPTVGRSSMVKKPGSWPIILVKLHVKIGQLKFEVHWRCAVDFIYLTLW